MAGRHLFVGGRASVDTFASELLLHALLVATGTRHMCWGATLQT
jgi:hypothetical protein